MTLLCLPSRVAASAAIERLNRPRLKNLYGLLSKPIRVAEARDPATRIPPFIERLWMPAYAMCFQTLQNGKHVPVWCSVDAWTGYFAFLESHDELRMREVGEESFQPNVGEADAVETARKSLLQFILRQRGQFNKPKVEDLESVRLYHFPVWVCYTRKGKRIDIRVLDGFTGSPGGTKMRVSVLDALVAARKQRQESL